VTGLVSLVTTDFAGITRGRAIPVAQWRKGGPNSVGWVPANAALTPFDLIADPNPWGSAGDLRLLADAASRMRFDLPGAPCPLDFVQSDIVELDGTPWPLCPRGLLKAALADLEAEFGLRLRVSFEHEFQILNAGWPSAPAFSLRALRRAEPFATDLMAMLDSAEMGPEVVIAEYGADQYEVAIAPAPGVAAADRAVALREVVREMVALRGWRASFAPKTVVEGVGNGVHIHFSLNDLADHPVTYDAARPGTVSAAAGSFVAGILRHLPALIAFTAPSPISGLRLQPHHWSSSYTWFGDQDREASLRICPVNRIGGGDPARAFNIEYRPADATACPHLALAVMVRAGIEGLRAGLPAPPLFSGDPTLLAPAERDRLRLHRLPASLPDALAALRADPTVTGWFDPRLIETYCGMKRMEMAQAGPSIDDALCARYATIY
jgi:glutamine synthetase